MQDLQMAEMESSPTLQSKNVTLFSVRACSSKSFVTTENMNGEGISGALREKEESGGKDAFRCVMITGRTGDGGAGPVMDGCVSMAMCCRWWSAGGGASGGPLCSWISVSERHGHGMSAISP